MNNLPIIELNAENLAKEHICCAIGSTPDAKAGTATKKAWMQERFAEGYRFFRLDAQGKCLIETTPGENAFAPVQAEGWLYLDCFWVSGKFKGQGIANRLLEKAAETARAEGRKGLVALSSDKKRAFLSDGDYLRHKGFVLADTAPPYYQLLALPFEENTPLPKFRENAKKAEINGGAAGVTIYYSHHCPHTAKYLLVLQHAAEEMGIPFSSVLIASTAEAQAAPNPFTNWAMYYDGQFVTNEIFSDGKFRKFIDSMP